MDERRGGEERREADRRELTPGPPGPPRGQERRDRAMGWRSRDILRAAALVAAVYALVQLLWFAHSLLFVAFLGILFGLALAGGVDRLKAMGLPRGVGAVLIVVMFLGALGGLGIAMAPTLRQQTEELREELPAGIDRLERWLQQQEGGVVGVLLGADREAPDPAEAEGETAGNGEAAENDEESDGLRERLTGEFGNLTRFLFPFLSSTLAVLAGVLAILFIAIYLSVQPDLYQRGLMHLFPYRARPKAELVLDKMAIMLRRWLVTQLIAMLAVGLITTVTLVLLRVPAAVALGVLAGLLEFIPIIGPIIASIPAIAMAFIDSFEKALAVAFAFIIIQQVESQILTPLLMKEGVDLPPILTLVVQTLMLAVFGFIGLIVAVPLLAAAMVPIKMLYVEDVVGDRMTLPGDDEDDDDDEVEADDED